MSDNGLKQHKVGIIGIVGMIYAMTAAGAYGIEDMVSSSGPGMTVIMLFVLPLIWAFPIALASSELGSAIPDECGFYRWVQRAGIPDRLVEKYRYLYQCGCFCRAGYGLPGFLRRNEHVPELYLQGSDNSCIHMDKSERCERCGHSELYNFRSYIGSFCRDSDNRVPAFFSQPI